MKKIFLAAAALAILIFPANAIAKTYKIRPGDCLSGIASRFGTTVKELAKINRISNPDLIFADATLDIPGETTGKAVTVSPKIFSWKHVNSNPFGNRRSPKKMINKFSLPEKAKEKLVEIVKNKEFRWAELRQGNRFEQMAFGNYRAVSNVVADWNKSKLYAARLYEVVIDDCKYFLAEPLVCHNWCWWREKVKKKKLLLFLTPPSVKGKPTVTASLERKKKAKHKCRPDWEAWTYAGHYIGMQKENRHDWSQYWGFNASFFPCELPLGDGVFRAGPALQYVGWRGEAGRAVDYDGQMNLVGGEAQYITGSTKTQLKVYVGEKHGSVEGKGFPYKCRQKNDLLAIEAAHEWWHSGRKWFHEAEVGGRAEIDLSGKRHSSWEGNPIPESEDPADDQYYYSLRAKTEIYEGKHATPTAELTAGYRGFDKSYHLEPRLGVKLFRKLAEIDVSYNWVEHSQNNMAGAHLIINASDGVKRLYFWLKAKNRDKQVKSQTGEDLIQKDKRQEPEEKGCCGYRWN